MIRRVIQKDSSGCGIACVAMLSGDRYTLVRKLAKELEIGSKEVGYYTRAGELRTMLKELGMRSGRARRVSKWGSINQLSIVGINSKETNKGPYWHWIVYVPGKSGGYVLDPLPRIKSSRRTDFGRMRLRSFIPVGAA